MNRVPVVHGSALFQGGETQVLATATVGSPEDEQRMGGVLDPGNRRLIVHYSSPPYATNEVCPPPSHSVVAGHSALSTGPGQGCGCR